MLYTGQNCPGSLTFYHTEMKQAKEPQLYFFSFELC